MKRILITGMAVVVLAIASLPAVAIVAGQNAASQDSPYVSAAAQSSSRSQYGHHKKCKHKKKKTCRRRSD